MATKRGYLQVSGGGNSGTQLLSNVLSGISNKYSAKEANEEQIARENILRDESNKRDRLLQAENTRRYEEGRTTAAATALENTRRYEVGQTRADQALARQENDRKAQFDLLNTNTVFTIDDQNAENAEIFKTRRANEDIEINGLKDFLSTVGTEFTEEDKKNFKSKEERDRAALGGAFNAASNNLIVNSGDTIDEQDAVMRRLVNLEALKKEFETTGLQGEERTNRIDEIINNQYGKRREELDKRIASGEGLSRERRTEIALSRIPENIRNNLLSPASASTILSNRVGGSSEADIRARETARIDNLFENSKAFSDATEKSARLDVLYKNANKKTGNKASADSYNKTDQTKEEVTAALNNKVFGSLSEVSKENTNEIAGVIKKLAGMGFSVYEIERAVASNTKSGLPIWGADNTNIESLDKIIASAEDIKNNRNNNSRMTSFNGRAPTREDLLSIRGSERTLAQMALSQLGLDRPSRQTLNVGSRFKDMALKDRELPETETSNERGIRQGLLQEREDNLFSILNPKTETVKNTGYVDQFEKDQDTKIMKKAAQSLSVLEGKREEGNLSGNPILERAIQKEKQDLKSMQERFELGLPLGNRKYELNKSKIQEEIDDLESEKKSMNKEYPAGKRRADAISAEIDKLKKQKLLARN